MVNEDTDGAERRTLILIAIVLALMALAVFWLMLAVADRAPALLSQVLFTLKSLA